ncbi:hypothetical protein IW261DRAFT_1416846 [Armillaria novae-zelandiae]|uniref:Uncharacterized protein n=1 Tax=Armillaria novae-zelandiae TaxID=153914 RepID=A0AA39PJY1_9AGAR|nr:hypothetical protein IW261DRAFT_1416846 [Armillaria novae-zelandiae]
MHYLRNEARAKNSSSLMKRDMTLSDIFDYFNENVITGVGPHGKAMYHHRWAVRGTFVITYDVRVGGNVRSSDATKLLREYLDVADEETVTCKADRVLGSRRTIWTISSSEG